MAKDAFNTVSDELLVCAQFVAKGLRSQGYKVKIEPSEVGYPNTPTMTATLLQTTLIIEVDNKPKKDRLKLWVGYARSQSKDTRVVLATEKIRSAEDLDFLRSEGVGVFETHSGHVIRIIQPQDVALRMSLPDISVESRKIRGLLGAAYQKIQDSYWKEGFEDACATLEREARRYLYRHYLTGRIIVLDSKGKPKTLTHKEINKMPIGALSDVFARFQRPNQSDSLIKDALLRINKDRIVVVHKKGGRNAEQRLRNNVSQHLWVILAALKEAVR